GVGLLFGADLPARRRVHLGVRARAGIAPRRAAAEAESRRSDDAREGCFTCGVAPHRAARRAAASVGLAKRAGPRTPAQGSVRRDGGSSVPRWRPIEGSRDLALTDAQVSSNFLQAKKRARLMGGQRGPRGDGTAALD